MGLSYPGGVVADARAGPRHDSQLTAQVQPVQHLQRSRARVKPLPRKKGYQQSFWIQNYLFQFRASGSGKIQKKPDK